MFSIDFGAKIDFYFDIAKQISIYLTEIIVETKKIERFCFNLTLISGIAAYFVEER